MKHAKPKLRGIAGRIKFESANGTLEMALILDGDDSFKNAYIRLDHDGQYLGAIDNDSMRKLLKLREWINNIEKLNRRKGTQEKERKWQQE